MAYSVEYLFSDGFRVVREYETEAEESLDLFCLIKHPEIKMLRVERLQNRCAGCNIYTVDPLDAGWLPSDDSDDLRCPKCQE